MIASPAPPPSRPPPRPSYALPVASRGMSPPACMRWTEGRQAWTPRRMRRTAFLAETFPSRPSSRLRIRLARGRAFCLLPTACRTSLLSAALCPQALGGVCVEAPMRSNHAKCASLPLASGVLNALTTPSNHMYADLAPSLVYRWSRPQLPRQAGDFA